MTIRKTRFLPALGTIIVAFVFPGVALPCKRLGPVSAEEMVKNADAIVRAVAVDYAKPPSTDSTQHMGAPDSMIRFRVIEVIRGEGLPAELTLPGRLVARDDFNDHAPPYKKVRPAGRLGSCSASDYKTGAEFMLIMKARNGSYSVGWYPLGPVNEQLRSEDDPWLVWVRKQAKIAR